MNLFSYIRFSILSLILAIVVTSCANRGIGPTGGPKDTIPPEVIKSIPENNSIKFNKKHIEIYFDENVDVDRASENVLVSPPQKKAPEIKSLGKEITIDFDKMLKDSTTYSIDFGNSIIDVNEKNPLKNYLFAFSTGNHLDSLKIAGTVINAENLNPASGTLVGVYSDLTDSAFYKKPFFRVARTNADGRFSINNLSPGKYKIYALDDASHDYYYQPGEGLAFSDSLLTPIAVQTIRRDTIWKDSLKMKFDSIPFDSIRNVGYTAYYPDKILLQLFKEANKNQYLVKAIRKEPFNLALCFNAPLTEMPVLEPLNFNWKGKYLLQKSIKSDTLTYWVTDSTIWKVDTMKIKMTYLKTDSLFKLKPQIDTLNVVCRKPKATAQPKVKPKIKALELKHNATSPFEIFNPIKLSFAAPLARWEEDSITLYQKVDTVWKEISVKTKLLDSTYMNLGIFNEWEPEMKYRLVIDSAAFTSIYHQSSKPFKADFKVRSLDEYSTMKIQITPFNPLAVLQVLDAKDVVVKSAPASKAGTVFEYLTPNIYYLRMFIDDNKNGKWDAGDLAEKRKPEQVYYYSKSMKLLANWEFEEVWNLSQLPPLLEQKPKELIKAALQNKQK
jgi:Bacterial Ig-like domain